MRREGFLMFKSTSIPIQIPIFSIKILIQSILILLLFIKKLFFSSSSITRSDNVLRLVSNIEINDFEPGPAVVLVDGSDNAGRIHSDAPDAFNRVDDVPDEAAVSGFETGWALVVDERAERT
jgi:hypothetical protein